jgi:hypothetical protein
MNVFVLSENLRLEDKDWRKVIPITCKSCNEYSYQDIGKESFYIARLFINYILFY